MAEDVAKPDVGVRPKQHQNANANQEEAAKKAAGAGARWIVGHMRLLSLALCRILVGRRRHRGRRRLRRGRIYVAVVWREGRGKKDRPDDDENHRKRVMKRQISTTKLCQQKQNSNRRDNRGAHKAANSAAAARATNSIAHQRFSSRTMQCYERPARL